MLFLDKEGWRTRAICSDPGLTQHDFFEGFERKTKQAKYDFLQRTCHVCPVAQNCDDWAQKNRPIAGLFAGKYWRLKGPQPAMRIIYSDVFRDSDLSDEKMLEKTNQ